MVNNYKNDEMYDMIREADRQLPSRKGETRFGVNLLNEQELKYFGAMRSFKQKPKFNKSQTDFKSIYNRTAKTSFHDLE